MTNNNGESAVAALKQKARVAGAPCVYANDNFGRWRSNLKDIIQWVLRADSQERSPVELLVPEPEDYFVSKPKHSAFYQTPLELLLKTIRDRTVNPHGRFEQQLRLVTADDACMRDLKLMIP